MLSKESKTLPRISSEYYLCIRMNSTNRYFLELKYKGTNFHGWQKQENAFSVQECIEKALSTFFRQSIKIQGSGRTDTGVHASHQVCHFETDLEIDYYTFIKGLNGILPKDISIKNIRRVKPDAHARFSATERSYLYRIINQKDPFLNELAWYSYNSPDIDQMNLAAKQLLLAEDFESFSKARTEVTHFRCKIKSASWERKEGELLFHITANRFLRGMVRAIVGTTVEIGLGKRKVEDMTSIIQAKSRKSAGKSAPACGLFLSQVKYPDEIYLD